MRKKNLFLKILIKNKQMNFFSFFTILSFSLVLLFLPQQIIAQKISEKEARTVAQNLFIERCSIDNPEKNFQGFDEVIKYTNEKAEVQFYIFNEINAFVIVSAERNAYPIIAYSFESNYDENNIPIALEELLKDYASELEIIKEKEITTDLKTQQTWNYYSKNYFKTTQGVKSVSPLLSSTWSQSCYYNEMCPADAAGPCGYVVVGCVATAMSQIMYYHKYPDSGTGSNVYSTLGGYGALNVDFSAATYAWDSMFDNLSASNHAVAQLCYHAGVSVNMNYSPTGSGANSQDAKQAFVDNFNYCNYIQFVEKQYFSSSDWAEILREEVYGERPVYYRGNNSSGSSGHAFVCDGFQGTDHFHFNWGWGGSANGYFYTSSLNPGSDFTYDQGIIMGIERPDNDSVFCDNLSTLTALTDTIEDGSGAIKYGNDTYCQWLIQPPGAGSITLEFLEFNLENYIDELKIYQGNSTSSYLLATFFGHDLPSSVLAYGPSMLIVFSTDQINRNQGWKAVYTSSPVGIENKDKEDFIIYPNPVSDKIYIQIKENLDNYAEWRIVDITAKELMSGELTQSITEINIQKLNAAMYYLQMIDKKGDLISVKNFIVQ